MNQDSSNTKHIAVLFLPVPPEAEWYSKKIAGVPFLLRNLLALQKTGIRKLIVWSEEPVDAGEKNLTAIKADPRLKLEIDWAGEKSLLLVKEASSILVFDGATLINECGSQVPLDSANSKAFPEELLRFLDEREAYILQSETLEQPVRLQNEKDFHTAEDRLLKSCGLNNDSFMDRLITRIISRQLTSLFLKTPFTPNQITFLSLFIGLGAALCFLSGGYEMGIAGSVTGFCLGGLHRWRSCTLEVYDIGMGGQAGYFFRQYCSLRCFLCDRNGPVFFNR